MRIEIAVFNHLLSQAPEVRTELAQFAGRRVAWVIPPITVRGVITAEGWLANCQGEAEATIRLNHAAVLAAAMGGEPLMTDVVLEGDSELGRHIGQLSRGLSWHWVDDLSRLVGDIAANRIDLGLRRAASTCGEVSGRLVESWFDYITEEIPLLASRYEVESFVVAVDRLRDDTERCDKRLALLERAISNKKIT